MSEVAELKKEIKRLRQENEALQQVKQRQKIEDDVLKIVKETCEQLSVVLANEEAASPDSNHGG